MTQEQKELLLKDICVRLPYGVKVEYKNEIFDVEHISPMYEEVKLDIPETWTVGVSEVKPYLFPMSSMTEEQKKEINKRYINSIDDYSISISHHSDGYWDDDTDAGFSDYLWIIDWFNKNHFDYQGLIKKGLAIDATGLNIY
jgi:hypothetical protein